MLLICPGRLTMIDFSSLSNASMSDLTTLHNYTFPQQVLLVAGSLIFMIYSNITAYFAVKQWFFDWNRGYTVISEGKKKLFEFCV